MIKLSELISIGQISQKINVVINLDKTNHAKERQVRHSDFVFADTDIRNIVDLSIPAISKALMLGTIKNGNDILIKHQDLNVVGSITKKNGQLEFIVITVMKKDDFMPKPGTKIIEV